MIRYLYAKPTVLNSPAQSFTNVVAHVLTFRFAVTVARSIHADREERFETQQAAQQ